MGPGSLDIMATVWFRKSGITQTDTAQGYTCSSGHVTLHQSGKVTGAQKVGGMQRQR